MGGIFEEIDYFWLMWDDISWAENIRSPKPANKYLKKIMFLPPIDFRPLVARNQFVSQTRLEDFMERIQEKAQSFSFLQTNTTGEECAAFVEETIHNIASAFHENTINKILPSPKRADYIDLLEDRRPSYGTALKLFTITVTSKMGSPRDIRQPNFGAAILLHEHSSPRHAEVNKKKTSDPSPI